MLKEKKIISGPIGSLDGSAVLTNDLPLLGLDKLFYSGGRFFIPAHFTPQLLRLEIHNAISVAAASPPAGPPPSAVCVSARSVCHALIIILFRTDGCRERLTDCALARPQADVVAESRPLSLSLSLFTPPLGLWHIFTIRVVR